MSKTEFSKHVRTRVHKTTLDEIAATHQRNVTHDTGAKRMPRVEISHNLDKNTYHVATTHRNDDGSDGPTTHKRMNENQFLHFAVRSSKHIPKFHPFPQEGSIETDHKGRVRIEVGHEDY